ncbi:MAG: restriction endonuclease [Halobacteriota archaeon]
MFDAMDDRGFVEFLSEVWEQRGWNTAVAEEDPGQFMITGDRGSGERGLMLVVPAEDETVAGKPVQSLVGICDAKNVDVGVVATRGEFSDDAERIAAANDVHLLDTAALEATVAEEGLEDLVEEFSTGSDSLTDRLPIPSAVPAVLRHPSPPPIPTRALTVLLVVVGVVALAIVGAQSMGIGLGPLGSIGAVPADALGLGGGGSGEDFTVTAVSLAGTGDDAVAVAWNAETRSSLTTADETKYDAPKGSKFVVVHMRLTNHGETAKPFGAEMLGFAANDTVRSPRELEDTDDGLPILLKPDQSETVWVVFSVEDDERSGTLLGLATDDTPPLRFEHDPSVESELADG